MENNMLQVLNMDFNSIGPEGGASIAEALAH